MINKQKTYIMVMIYYGEDKVGKKEKGVLGLRQEFQF